VGGKIAQRVIFKRKQEFETHTGTKEETPDTDKGSPGGLPRQSSTLPAFKQTY